MIAIVNNWLFEQIWIGADDKLPRKARAVFLADPARLRHEIAFSNWQLDPAVPAEAFASSSATSATRIAFTRPDLKLPPGLKPPAPGKVSTPQSKPSKTQ
jgi:hypothetical protein